MNKAQTNYLNMTDAALGVMDANGPTWGNISPLVAVVARAKTIREAISAAAQRQTTSSKGVTIDKDELEDEAIRLTMAVVYDVQAYAIETDNDELLENLPDNPTQLDRMRDPQLIERLRAVHTRIAAISPGELLPYEITAPRLGAMSAAIEAFAEAVENPRNTIGAVRESTEAVAAEFRKLRVAFGQMDRLIRRYQTQDPQFYGTYRAARVVIDLRGPGNGDGQDGGPSNGGGGGVVL